MGTKDVAGKTKMFCEGPLLSLCLLLAGVVCGCNQTPEQRARTNALMFGVSAMNPNLTAQQQGALSLVAQHQTAEANAEAAARAAREERSEVNVYVPAQNQGGQGSSGGSAVAAPTAAVRKAPASPPPKGRCRGCSFDNTENARFCESCGTALFEKCPKCATESRFGSKFCNQCGENLATFRAKAWADSQAATPFVVPAGMTALGKNAQGYEEYKYEATGMVFVLIPAGVFVMGSNDGCDDEKPPHEVAVSSFLISKYEVTQAVWQKTMGNNPSDFKGDDNPVEYVSWEDCREFCRKTGLRLPTEAEWEYACRGGSDTKYFFGDDTGRLGEYAWFADNSGDMTLDSRKTVPKDFPKHCDALKKNNCRTHPVGEKRPNGFGVYDMSGNVQEWCEDRYGEDYYSGSPHDNPKGATDGDGRASRGGLGSTLTTTVVRRTGMGRIVPGSLPSTTGPHSAVFVVPSHGSVLNI